MPAAGYKKRVAIWTEEMIIEKLKEWAEKFGEPPTATEWNPSDCRYSAELSARRGQAWLQRAARFEAGEFPWTGTVHRRFGGWNNALRAAGLPVRTSGTLDPELVVDPSKPRGGFNRLKSLIGKAEEAEGEERKMMLFEVAEHAMAEAEKV